MRNLPAKVVITIGLVLALLIALFTSACSLPAATTTPTTSATSANLTGSTAGWWRQKDLGELFNLPAQPVNMSDVLSRPIEYRDQKISFTGNIMTGFEWVSVVDARIWPEYHGELDQALDQTGLAAEVYKSERIGTASTPGSYGNYISPELDFSGFLEFGGNYGHMGGWSYQFFITEMFPHTDDSRQKDAYRALFGNYVNMLLGEKQAITAVIDRWVSAMKTGDVAGLKSVYHPDSNTYKALLTESGQEKARNNIMGITIKGMHIDVTGSAANIHISNATVIPEKSGSSVPGGGGIFQLREISLKKDGSSKIDWFDYSPDPPSISIPTATASTTR